MIWYSRIAVLAVAVGCRLDGGVAQYASCNGTVADIGNGRCDAALNVPACGYDGGDCCPCTCSDGPTYSCSDSDSDCLYPDCDTLAATSEEAECIDENIGDGWCDWENNHAWCSWDGGDCCEGSCVSTPTQECGIRGFPCLDPVFFEPEIVAKYPECVGNWLTIGDGRCNPENNNPGCGYDGGDCCFCTCSGNFCSMTDFNCFDPTAGTEFYECQAPPPDSISCSAEVQLEWTVETSEQAQALAAAVNCSGGSFEVEWRGKVVVDETIYVVDGTVLTVRGADTGDAVIDGNAATRIFTVVDAVLHLNDVNVTSGTSVAGGAIAAARSVVTLNRTNFVGNIATAFGGAVFVSGGSDLSCTGGGTFTNNRADLHGGAMWVTGGSVVSCGSSWVNNTAASRGGALVVVGESSVSWREEATFAFNAGYVAGAIMVHNGSSVSWSGVTSFISNSAVWKAGGVMLEARSTVSWTSATTFVNNVADGNVGGAVNVIDGSAMSWSGTTEFVANTATRGGALYLINGSSISWTGTTEFTSNEASIEGGAVGSQIPDSVHNTLESVLTITGPTTFYNNSCGLSSGGALALLGGLSVSIGAADVSFTSNTAAVSGGAVFVSGTGVGPVFQGVSFVSNSAQIGGAVSSVASGNLVESAGSNPTTFERCHFVDNQATTMGGAVESAAGQDDFVSSVFEGNRAGTGGALRLAGISSMENCSFVDNVSYDGGGSAVSIIGSMRKMENISFSGNVFDCQPGTFLGYHATGDPYEAACKGCGDVCDGCSLDEPPLVPTCTEELDHTTSAGGSTTLEELRIDPGYWRATTPSPDVLACFYADACLGGVTGTAGYCLQGYEGPYCSVCSDGYTRELGYTCTKCSDSAGGIALAGVLAVAALVVAAAAFSYLVSGKGTGTGRGVVERLGRYIPLQSAKIVLVAWQILTQFSSVANVAYPDIYQRCVDALGVFNFDLSWILSATCVIGVDFHDRLLMTTIGPIIALLFLAFTYTMAARMNRGISTALQIVWNKHVSMVLLLAFLVYSSVSSVLFMSFACEDLDDGKNYLRADYRIECDSPKHKAFQVYAGFMVVLYTVGIPTFYGSLLFRDRKILKQDQTDHEEDARVKSTSDLWKPYKPSVFYYEVIECGRRVLLAGVVVFIYPNTAAQIAISLVMGFVFVVVSEALAPYASQWDTWLNRIGHGVVYMSMFVALLMKVDVSDEHTGGQKVFGSLLVAAHVCLVLVVVVETIVLAGSNFRDSGVMARRRKVAPEGDSFSGEASRVELPYFA